MLKLNILSHKGQVRLLVTVGIEYVQNWGNCELHGPKQVLLHMIKTLFEVFEVFNSSKHFNNLKGFSE